MARTIVIGAGVVGLACAYALRKRGEDVLVVDAGEPGAACSRGNAGWIVPCFSTPLPAPSLTLASLRWLLRRDSPLFISLRALPSLVPWLWQFHRHCNEHDYLHGVRSLAGLNERTHELFAELAADGVRSEMRRDGILFAYLSAAETETARRDFELLSHLRYPMPTALDGDEVRALEPQLSTRVRAGFLVHGDAHVRPESFSAGLVARLGELGTRVESGVRVTGFVQRRDGRVAHLQTTRGRISGERFVIAAGAWSRALCRQLGADLPVEAGKGYNITMHSPPWSFRRPVYLAEAHVGCTPFEGALRFAGTMELSGVNERLDTARLRSIRRAAEPYLTSPPRWEDGEPWVGMRPITPDGLPIIGELPGTVDVFVATGHAMLGLTLAPATGKLLADVMIDRSSEIDGRPFDPRRFVTR